MDREKHHRALLLLCALNVADLCLTLLVFELGGGEGNPLLAAAWDRGFSTFVAAKVALAAFGVSILWEYRDEEAARWGVVACCGIYLGVICIHVKVLSDLTGGGR